MTINDIKNLIEERIRICGVTNKGFLSHGNDSMAEIYRHRRQELQFLLEKITNAPQ